MKVARLDLKYFKRFRDQAIDFTDPVTGIPRDLIVLLGANGSGKSTVLQALAAVLGAATGKLGSPADLDWPGFDLDLVDQAYRLPGEAAVEVAFDADEIQATREFCALVPLPTELQPLTVPAEKERVTLTLRDRAVRAGSPAEYFQFRGRQYAKQVVKMTPEGFDIFRRVGAVFWHTEQRIPTSLPSADETSKASVVGLDTLRRQLAVMWQFHAQVTSDRYQPRPGQRDFYAALEEAYSAVFPGRTFEGAVPRAGMDEPLSEPWFFLYDGHRQYELSELSGGERAVFPMLYEFASLNIHRSVVLIDEIELHLHPPMQQALLRALSRLGSENQFIITTHSPAVEAIVPEGSVIRLEAE